MPPPLYFEHQAPTEKPETAHAGLWFERFFFGYQDNGEIADTAKQTWIKTVTGEIGKQEQLDQFHQRQQDLIKDLDGDSHCYKTDWHFVTGMGNPHPVENGFSWHPTLAVPYLAGSAVKGLVRAWVELNDDKLCDADKKALLKYWFGTEDKQQVAEQAGKFIFFDAIPHKVPTLICDIMTPHMGDWYEQGDNAYITNPNTIPADWHEPRPVPFLAVKNAEFIFSIAPRTQSDAVELNEIFLALKNALKWLGAGAKTAVGYGYMSIDTSYAKELHLQQEEQDSAAKWSEMSDQQRQIAGLRAKLTEKQKSSRPETISGQFYSDLKNLIDVAASTWPVEDKAVLKEIGQEILKFLNATSNKTAKALLKKLD